jgi:hypothetical protein
MLNFIGVNKIAFDIINMKGKFIIEFATICENILGSHP